MRLLLILLSLLVTAQVMADDDASTIEDDATGLASRLMTAVLVIDREHIAPPPVHEMVHQLMVSTAYELQAPMPDGHGRDLSSLESETELEAHLKRSIKTSLIERSKESEYLMIRALEYRVLESVMDSLSGSNGIRTRKENDVQEKLVGNRYVGIGIALGNGGPEGPFEIRHVVPGGPAERAGIRDGDVIREVDGERVDHLPLSEVIDRIRGPANSTFTLTVARENDSEKTLTLTRDVVPFKHVTHDATVITIRQLTSATVQELREIEADLNDSDGPIVLKLEGVSGTNLHHGVLLADALLDGGVIGRVRKKYGVREFTASQECLFRGQRMRVIVDERTTGAVEWVVAALQDTGRARIAGTQTAGFPFVTESFEVPGSEWVLQLTNGVLERTDGRSLMDDPSEIETARLRVEEGSVTPRELAKLVKGGGVTPDVTRPSVDVDDDLGNSPRPLRERLAPLRPLLVEKLLKGFEDSE